MRTCECPAACSGIRSEASWQDRLDVDRGLPVPELADVEVVRAAVELFLRVNPAEEDVARGLHQALTHHDSLPVCRERTSPEQWFEHRWLRLLDLEKERVSGVATEEQHHPGACSDTPDADDFSGEIGVAETLNQRLPLGWKRSTVAAEERAEERLETGFVLAVVELDERDDQRWIRDEPPFSVDGLGQSCEREHPIVSVPLRLRQSEHPPELLVVCLQQLLVDRFRVEPRIPDVQFTHRGESPHRLPVRAHGRAHGVLAFSAREVALSSGDLEARRQAFDVPLERAGKRFVEVVEVEHEIAFWRRVAAEVQEMGIPRELNPQSGRR